MGEKTRAKHMQGTRFDSFPAPQEKHYNLIPSQHPKKEVYNGLECRLVVESNVSVWGPSF